MSFKTPLVSIIIPTFNRGHLISETLDSVLAQSYENWECIVVDDGSTDDSKAILAKYIKKDSRFKFFVRPTNKPKGANACRNYGFEKSNGEYIQWFDSDDLMHPEKLKLKIKYALQYNSDVIKDAHSFENNVILSENPNIEYFQSSVFYIDFIIGKCQLITDDVMLRRPIIRELRFDETLHKAQEFEFFSRIFQQNLRYCFIDIPLTYYRKTEVSISTNTSKIGEKQQKSLIKLCKLLKERFPDNPLIIKKAERQGRKTYKTLIKANKLNWILSDFKFFKESYHKSTMAFMLYIAYNIITKRGFDKMKPKNDG